MNDMMSCNKIRRFFFLWVFCHYYSVIRTQARTSSPGTRRSENRKSFECKECNADYCENEQGRLKENINREERYNGRTGKKSTHAMVVKTIDNMRLSLYERL